jgi:hypothetical protein
LSHHISSSQPPLYCSLWVTASLKWAISKYHIYSMSHHTSSIWTITSLQFEPSHLFKASHHFYSSRALHLFNDPLQNIASLLWATTHLHLEPSHFFKASHHFSSFDPLHITPLLHATTHIQCEPSHLFNRNHHIKSLHFII